MNPEKINILDLDRAGMVAFFASIGEPAYRAHQLLQWLHQYGISDFQAMTNFSKALRQRLSEMAVCENLTPSFHQEAKDGTQKWLLTLKDGNSVETVFIPERTRGTLCVSSQVGCMLNCTFCSTGTQGFSRNLSVAEIIGQVFFAVRALSEEGGRHDKKITNVVMMGMGEPLLNFDAVVSAMNLMMDDLAYGLAKRRVTLSTSGVVPQIRELAKVSDVALAVSLHAPNDILRNELVPINKKYPLSELIAACKEHFAEDPKRKVTFEYVMLKDVNDSRREAKQLARLLEGVPAKVNLIPFNPFPGTRYTCSNFETIQAFQEIVMRSGVQTTIRKTRGEDIDGACGQLVGDFTDRTRRKERFLRDRIVVEAA